MQGIEHEPTEELRKMVETMIAVGITQADVATVLGIDPKTLRHHYRAELDRAAILANTKVAQNLFKIATGTGREAVTAGIFWMKVRAGWSEHAPPPLPKPDAPPATPGKKEQAAADAAKAEEGTGWSGLVN